MEQPSMCDDRRCMYFSLATEWNGWLSRWGRQIGISGYRFSTGRKLVYWGDIAYIETSLAARESSKFNSKIFISLYPDTASHIRAF